MANNDEEMKVISSSKLRENVETLDDVDVSSTPSPDVTNTKKEGKGKKILGEIKAFFLLVLIIAAIAGGTWYWYTHIYDGNKETLVKKDEETDEYQVYSYLSKESRNDLLVVGNYLIERNESQVLKVMNLKGEVLFEGNVDCSYIEIGSDGELYFISDESGDYGNTIILSKLDGDKVLELDPIGKNGVYYTPFYYEDDGNYVLLGFSGLWSTVDDSGNETGTYYVHLINDKTYELENYTIFGNQVRLSEGDPVYTEDSKYVIISTIGPLESVKYGLLDIQTGNIVIEPTYEELKYVRDGVYVAQKDGKAGIIDYNKKKLVDFQYDFIDVNDDFYVVSQNNKLAIMDSNYKLITDFVFDYQGGDSELKYDYYLCCASINSFAAYKIEDKYVLVTNYGESYGVNSYDKHEAYVIKKDGTYETITEYDFTVEDDFIYSSTGSNQFVVFNTDLTEKYKLDLTKYDSDVYRLNLINHNTIEAELESTSIYFDYETGKEISKVNEFEKEIESFQLSYKNGKLTINTGNNEKKFDLANFDFKKFYQIEDGYYYINESSNNSLFIYVGKGE